LQGRAQVVPDSLVSSEEKDQNNSLVFYLDGAHSPESMEICAKWFSNVTKESRACDNSKKVYLMISLALSCLNRPTFAFITSYVILYMNTFLLGHMQILLFNCMSVRDPMRLLPHLVNTSIQNGMMVKFSHSLNKYLCIHLSNKSGILS
jgi:folylpolyglutamate synthase